MVDFLSESASTQVLMPGAMSMSLSTHTSWFALVLGFVAPMSLTSCICGYLESTRFGWGRLTLGLFP